MPGTVASSTSPGWRIRWSVGVGPDVVNELERLRDDRAVECVVRDLRGVGEVTDDRRLQLPSVAMRMSTCSTPRPNLVVVGRRDLEDTAADVA